MYSILAMYSSYVMIAGIIALIGSLIYKKMGNLDCKNIAILSFLAALFNVLIVLPTGYFAPFVFLTIAPLEVVALLISSKKSTKINFRHIMSFFIGVAIWVVIFASIFLIKAQFSHPQNPG